MLSPERASVTVFHGARSGSGTALSLRALHLRLANGKIHVEPDWTEDAVAELIAAGVPKEDIVLAFNPPEMRQHPEFAVA